ncbi:MAG: Hpt domain-containing protein [Bacteriovoracaceae bacterium]|nr:Hpt domain-containing protein [Bacteriovoracaceae bacterium]
MIIEVSSDLEDILPKYLDNRRKEINELKAFCDQQDFTSLKTRGHRLAGNAPSYGMPLLGELGRKIEQDALSQELSNMALYIAQMEEFLNNVQVEFVEEDECWDDDL